MILEEEAILLSQSGAVDWSADEGFLGEGRATTRQQIHWSAATQSTGYAAVGNATCKQNLVSTQNFNCKTLKLNSTSHQTFILFVAKHSTGFGRPLWHSEVYFNFAHVCANSLQYTTNILF
jgi:hypothetical protein